MVTLLLMAALLTLTPYATGQQLRTLGGDIVISLCSTCTVDVERPVAGSQSSSSSPPPIRDPVLTQSQVVALVSDAVAAERSRALAAEERLDAALALLKAEQSRAVTAELGEISRATRVESSLGISISVVADAVSAEVSRATRVDGVLSAALVAEVSRATSTEDSLAAAASGMTGSLSNAIVSGLSRADVAVAASLSGAVATANSNSAIAQGTLSASIWQEASRANVTTSLLQARSSDLSTAVFRALSNVDAVSSAVALTASRASGLESSLTSNINAVSTAVATEVSRATGMESAISTSVHTGVRAVSTAVEQEISRAVTADAALNASVLSILPGTRAFPAFDCAEIFRARANTPTPMTDGYYFITAGATAPFLAFCKVEAGTGWTMVLNLDTSDSNVMWWGNPLWQNNALHGTLTPSFAWNSDIKSPAWNTLTGTTHFMLIIHQNVSRRRRCLDVRVCSRPH
jgi:hypothetical protein